MTKDEFENTLEKNLHRQPFQPFVVELTSGRRIVIKKLPVAHGGGGAGFIDPDDGALVDFVHNDVRSMGALEQEVHK